MRFKLEIRCDPSTMGIANPSSIYGAAPALVFYLEGEVGIEPTSSRLTAECFTILATLPCFLLAVLRGIEPLFSERQSDVLVIDTTGPLN